MTGFSSIIIANNVFKDDQLDYTFELLCGYGFRRFTFLLNHDVTSSTLNEHIRRKKLASDIVHAHKPRSCVANVHSNIIISDESVYEKQISALSIKRTEYLPIELPIFKCGDWIDSSLNYLLYKQHKKPLFISFEKNMITYDKDFALHLIDTRLASFAVDINSFVNPKLIPYMRKIIYNDATIIPCVSGMIGDYTNLDEKLSFFKEKIGQNAYSRMILNASRSATAKVLGD